METSLTQLAAIKDIEARLTAILKHIQKESLDRLKKFENQRKALKAIVEHYKKNLLQTNVYGHTVCQQMLDILEERGNIE